MKMDSKSRTETKSNLMQIYFISLFQNTIFYNEVFDIDLKVFNNSNHEKYTLVKTPTVYPEKYTKSR